MKTNLTLSIDTDVVLALKKQNINKSKVINNYLKTYLGIKDDNIIPNNKEEIEKKIMKEEIKIEQLKDEIKRIDIAKRKQEEEDKKGVVINC